MRELVVTEFVTLDGVTEAPGGEPTHPHSGWTIPYGSPELFAYKLEETRAAGSLLLGRHTYEQFADAWPGREGEFADRMNTLPKHVVTTRPAELSWNAVAVTGEPMAAVRALKAGEGGPIVVHGSATLVRALLEHDLVDELRLMVYPVVVGGGAGIWPDGRHRIGLERAAVTPFPGGATLHVFRAASS